jgi:tetratricopeptide (TPR) repeat protein
MISDFKDNERVYGSLSNILASEREELFCDPSAELKEALKCVLGDASDQTEKERLLEGIVQDLSQQAINDNSNLDKQINKGSLNYSKLKLLNEFIKKYEETIGICLSLQGSSKEAELCILKAMILKSIEEYDTAIHYYEQAVTLLPSSIVARLCLSFCLRITGKYKEGLEAINQLLELEPDKIIALKEKATILDALHRNDEALSVLKHAQAVAPEDGQLLLHAGVLLIKEGRTEAALKTLEEAIWWDPLFFMAWVMKGFALSFNADHAGALGCFERARQIDNQRWEAVHLVGLSYANIGEHGKALEHFFDALSLASGETTIYWSIAVSLRNLDRNDEALKTCDTALEKTPDFLLAWEEKAFNFAVKRDYHNALVTCERALKICGNSSRLWEIKGHSHAELGNWESAVSCYEAGLKETPDDHLMWYNMGSNLLKMSVQMADARNKGNVVDKALKCGQQCLEIDPEYGQGYYICGLAYMVKGDVTQGFSFLTRASTLGVLEATLLVGNLKK